MALMATPPSHIWRTGRISMREVARPTYWRASDARLCSRAMLHRFGPFELDEDKFELRRRGKPVALQRRVLELITHLVNHRDRLVTKEELFAGPWRGTTVTNAALAQTIMLARKALSERSLRSSGIQTVRGKGY